MREPKSKDSRAVARTLHREHAEPAASEDHREALQALEGPTGSHPTGFNLGLPLAPGKSDGLIAQSSLPSDRTARSENGVTIARRPFFELGKEDLKLWLDNGGHPGYRADQILEWVYLRGASSFEAMSNLPLGLRRALSGAFMVYGSTVVRDQASTDGTRKLLLAWPDGRTTECVLIPDGARRTACLSTQVGCPVRCAFCASGLGGLERQLSVGEIVEQAVRLARLDRGLGRKNTQTAEADRTEKVGKDKFEDPNPTARRGLTHVVFMGLGEPLANYQATLEAVRRLNASWGFGIGARKITLSTVGLPAAIRRLADEGLQVTLALSLHAPNDALRRRIIPWAEYATIAELFEAADVYFQKTGREITLEYILLGGVNDGLEHAAELAAVAKRIRANINLIAYNEVSELPFRRPTAAAVARFQGRLREAGINAHVRRSRGRDIDAACGQLRRDWESGESGDFGKAGFQNGRKNKY